MMDLISRQDVIDAVIKYCTKYDLRELLADIEVLPSVEQAQKTGKWQKYEGRFDYNWECSECGCSAWEKTAYCAHCGAKMGEEDE